MTKLVGYKRFTSKKNGKDYCVANVITTYNQRNIDAGCVGNAVEEIFMPDELYDLLKPGDVGKELQLDYELSGGRAYLVDVSVIGK